MLPSVQKNVIVISVLTGAVLQWIFIKRNVVSIVPVILEFEHFSNNISASCAALASHFPTIFIISDSLPYPPLSISIPAHLHLTSPDLRSPLTHRLIPNITASHVLLLPDFAAVLPSPINALSELAASKPDELLAVPASPGHLTCQKIELLWRYWTVVYTDSVVEGVCDAVRGPHALLMPTSILWKLTDPFCRPSPECVYIQTAYAGHKVSISDSAAIILTSGPRTARERDKLRQYRRARRAQFYQSVGVRRVWRGDGTSAKSSSPGWEWHGCSRSTQRCFASIVDDMPDYLYSGRWTPPCCLRHIRRTARHVFHVLRQCRARFWLEGGSLLGAVRNGDIIPWDSDVDIGIYQEDIPDCSYLHAAVKQPVTDPHGFVWEKAPEGRFFRVQYSVANRVHVDIFPFYSVNGTMTKDTWFETHPQDCEFPEHYLKPLETVEFVGVNVTVPNRVQEFLEMKFGTGVVENPQYPTPERLPFPSGRWSVEREYSVHDFMKSDAYMD